MPGTHLVEQFARGLPVPEDQIRAAYHAELDRLAGQIGADAPRDDDGWQHREDRAVALTRGVIPLSWEALFSGAFTGTLAPEVPAAKVR
ncbi:MAG: hypothetical protein JWR37_3630 [Mycobacterium sp.]|nr:hypothetical protein [Mycobacterium sp.]